MYKTLRTAIGSIILLLVFGFSYAVICFFRFYHAGFHDKPRLVLAGTVNGRKCAIVERLEEGPIPSYFSQLYIQDKAGPWMEFYIDHESASWRSAKMLPVMKDYLQVWKNGNPILVLNFITSTTVSMRDGNVRDGEEDRNPPFEFPS